MAIINSALWERSRVVKSACAILPADAKVVDIYADKVDPGDIVIVRGGGFDENVARKLLRFRDEGAVVVNYCANIGELKVRVAEVTRNFFW